MGQPWTFARRVAVGFTVLLTLAMAISASTTLALRALRSGGDAHVGEGQLMHLVEVERLRRAFHEKLASQREHALSGEFSFLSDAELSRRQFIATRTGLHAHAEAGEETRILEAVARAEAAHEEASQRFMDARARGHSREALAPFLQEATRTRLETLSTLDQLASFTRQRLSGNAQRALLAERRAFGFVLAAATLGLLVAVGLTWVLLRALWPLHRQARSTEARFRLLVEGIQDYALYLLDRQGRVASWNPGAERIQGWGAEEIIGRPGTLLYPPEALTEGVPRRDLEQAEREGRQVSESARMRKDGTRFWAETLLTALRDPLGRIEGYAVLTRDITERNRLERAQRLFTQVEDLFLASTEPHTAVASLPRLLVPELADGCLLFVTSSRGVPQPLALAHVSPEREELLWRLVRHSTPHSKWRMGVCHVVRTGKPELFTEVTPEVLERLAVDAEHLALLRRLDVCSALTVPLRAGGQTLGALMLLSQRPERRFTRTDQVFIEELAGRGALVLENALLLREAQGALDLIGEAAHDLGNPLHVLQLRLEKLRRQLPQDPEKQREGLTSAVRHTQRLGRLLHNLLDLSRLSSGKLELEVGEVDLGELVREGLARHAEQSEEVGSLVTLESDPGVVGTWDRLRLERVLTNLLSNALKYGKGRPIELRVARTQSTALLSVRDHGPGIAPEQQRSIFERFKKAPARGEKKEGFGLGLYIVRQLVEAHGGRVWVDSTPGQGATFNVELPLHELRREVDGASGQADVVH